MLSSVVLHSFNFGVHGLSKPISRPVLPHLHSHIDTANTWTTWRSLSLPASKAHQSPNLKDCVAKHGNDALKAIWLEKKIKHDADLVHRSSASWSYSQQLWVRCHVCPESVHPGWSPAIILIVGLGLPRVAYVFWVGLAWRNKRRRGRETTACYKHGYCTCINNFWQKRLSHCISLHDIAHRIYHDICCCLLCLRVNIATFAVLVRSAEQVNHEKQFSICALFVRATK